MYARRLVAAFTIVLAAAGGLAACGGDDDPSSSDSTTSVEGGDNASPTPTEPQDPTSFDDVPGKALTYQRSSSKFAVQLKPIQIQYFSQFADKPADPGTKFMVVFVAMRPKLTDRGVTDLRMDELYLRFQPGDSGGCDSPAHVNNIETCFLTNKTSVVPVGMDESDWRSETWMSVDYTGINLDAGVDYREPLIFQVKDGAEPKDGLQLCGNPDGAFVLGTEQDLAGFPCVPIANPDATEN